MPACRSVRGFDRAQQTAHLAADRRVGVALDRAAPRLVPQPLAQRVVLPQALTIFHEYEQSLLGLILIVFMIFLRRGIVPSVAAIFAGWRK